MPKRLFLCERGNTLLTNGTDMVAWMDMDDGRLLQVTWTPDNYPALYVETLPKKERKGLADHIKNLLDLGWIASKLNHVPEEVVRD